MSDWNYRNEGSSKWRSDYMNAWERVGEDALERELHRLNQYKVQGERADSIKANQNKTIARADLSNQVALAYKDKSLYTKALDSINQYIGTDDSPGEDAAWGINLKISLLMV